MKLSIKRISRAARVAYSIFKHPGYLSLTVFIVVLVTTLAIWMPNMSFVATIVQSSAFSVVEKIVILVQSLEALTTNFTLLGGISMIVISLLTGMNISMFVYYLRKKFRLDRSAGTSAVGTFIGLLGVGCASCGSFILSSIFGLSITAGVIGFFPLRGFEFTLVGILILLWANYTLALKLENPLVCSIEK